jgi:hypothetical protein
MCSVREVTACYCVRTCIHRVSVAVQAQIAAAQRHCLTFFLVMVCCAMQVAQQALGEGPLGRGLSDVLGGFMQPAGYSNRLNVSCHSLGDCLVSLFS